MHTLYSTCRRSKTNKGCRKFEWPRGGEENGEKAVKCGGKKSLRSRSVRALCVCVESGADDWISWSAAPEIRRQEVEAKKLVTYR